MKKQEKNKFYKTNSKRGISLIALVITIIIILIISAAVIITTTQNSPIEEANEAVIKSDIRTMQEKYELAYADKYMEYMGDESKITNSDFADVIPDKYRDDFKATADGIIYVGDNETIEKIAAEMGIEKKEYTIVEDIIVTATENSVEINVVIAPGESVDEYIYQIREKGTDTWEEFSDTGNGLIIEDLVTNVEYEIKVTVIQGDKIYESEIVEITTKEDIVLGTLTLKLNDANGETYSENTWTNQNVYVAVSGENTTYSVTGANQVASTTSSSILTKDGTSTVTIKTTSSTKELTDSYTVKIDKTAPTINEFTSNTSEATNTSIVLTGKAKDTTSGVYAYQFSTDASLTANSTGWQTITSTTSEITQTYTVSANGKYYFYVKDNAENVTKQEIEINNIDNAAPTTNAPTLTSTTNSVTATFNQTDTNGIDSTTRAYAIKKTDDEAWGEWITSNSDTYTFENLTMNTSYDVKTKVKDTAGNESQSQVATIATLLVGSPSITISPETWTNGSVEATIEYPEMTGASYEYSTDGTSWNTATSTIQKVTITANKTIVYAKMKDSTNQYGKTSTYEITNIDSIAPIINSVTADIESTTNQNVTITAKAIDSESGIVAYQFSIDGNLTAQSTGWQTITSTTSEITQTYTVSTNEIYYFYVKDAAGNISKEEIVIENIDVDGPTLESINVIEPNSGIYKAPQTVTIEATYSENVFGTAPELKIKFGEGTERVATFGEIINNKITYTYEISNGDNGKLTSTSYTGSITDEAGNTLSVSNMTLGGYEITADTLAPSTIAPLLTSNTNSIIATFRQTDTNGIDNATRQYAIKKTDVETWGEWVISNTDTYTFENLEMDTSYDVKTKASDEIGNESESQVATISTVNVTTPTITAPLEWTNQNVIVTINYPEIEGTTKEYSTDGTVWEVSDTITIELEISTNKTTVYARLKDTNGQVSDIATHEVTNIDKDLPKINSLTADITEPTNKEVTLTGKAIDDLSGIVGYQFSTNEGLSIISSGWQTITSTTSEITQTYTVSTNDTYYFYVKDDAGNVSKEEIVVSNIDDTYPTTNAPTLTSTTNSVTATFNQTDTNGIDSTTRAYAIKKTEDAAWGEWITSDTDTYTFENLTMNVSYDVKTKVTDVAGNTAESTVASKSTVNIEEPTLTFEPATWTNGNVKATIKYNEIAGTTRKYSIDGTSWTTVTGVTQEITISTNNTTVTAQIIDSTNQKAEVSETVYWIDNKEPTINSLTSGNTNPTNVDITLTGKAIDSESGIVGYQFSTDDSLTAQSTGWQTITSTTSEITQTYTVSTNGTYYFYVKDAAGNTSKQEIVIENIDKVVPVLESINVTSPDAGTYAAGQQVTIIATYSKNVIGTAPELKIKFGTGEEKIATAGEITNNTITYTYAIESGDNGILSSTSYTGSVADAAGNSLTVSNMTLGGNKITADTTTPNTEAPVLVSNTNSITATFKQTDSTGIDNATRQYAIKKTDEEAWGEWITSDTDTYTFENLTMNTSYDVKTKVKDNVGNESDSQVATLSTVNITKPTISASTQWAKSVDVTIIYPEIEGTTNEYSTDGTSWKTATSTTQVVTVDTNNTTVYAKVTDSIGQTSGNATYTVSNIDEILPIINSLTADKTEPTNGNVVLTGKAIDSETGIVAYQFSTDDSLTADSTGWQTIATTTSEITQTHIVTTNDTYYFYVKDGADNIAKKEIIVENIDNVVPTLESLSVTSPDTGTYSAGQQVTIVATYSENIAGTAPELKIKFGEGTEKTVTSGIVTNNTITYTYTIQAVDSGILASTGYSGIITDEVGNSLTVTNMTLSGNTITAKTESVIQSWNASSTTDFHAKEYRTKITSAKFSSSLTIPTTAIVSWDVSAAQNGSVMAYVEDDGNSGYILTIAGNEKVYANENSSYMLYNFTALTQIENMSLLDTSRTIYMRSMFDGCSSLTSLDLNSLNTSQVTNMQSVFAGCSSLTSLDLSNLDTSQVTDMSNMFYVCSGLTSLDVSNFDTSQVTDMNYMFFNCNKLINLNVSNFNTSQVTNMSAMFYECWSLGSLEVSNFDTSQVTDMSNMFYDCSNLQSVNLSSFNTSQVTDMRYMFFNCNKLINLNVSNFNTSQVTNMSVMFYQCESLGSLDVSNFDTSQVTNMSNMFGICSGLTSLDLSSFNTNNVTNMYRMFYGCNNLITLDLSNFNTSNVTDMSEMFNELNHLEKITLGADFSFLGNGSTSCTLPTPSADYIDRADGYWYNLNEEAFLASEIPNNVADTYSAKAPLSTTLVTGLNFYQTIPSTATSVTFTDEVATEGASLTDVSEKEDLGVVGWLDGTTYKVSTQRSGKVIIANTNCSAMFLNKSSLTSVAFDNIDTSNVTDMSSMFAGGTVLTSLDLSSFDISNVTNIDSMFYDCSNLQSVNLSSFNTSNVTDMGNIFSGCSSLTSADVSKWSTSNVTDMSYMFADCSNLTSLTLTSFDTSKVTNMSSMFKNCSSLTTLSLSSFNTSQVTTMSSMFTGMNHLEKVTLGSNFSFVGTDGYLPSQSSTYVKNANGYWYTVDMTAYLPANVPSKTAKTYYSKRISFTVAGTQMLTTEDTTGDDLSRKTYTINGVTYTIDGTDDNVLYLNVVFGKSDGTIYNLMLNGSTVHRTDKFTDGAAYTLEEDTDDGGVDFGDW